MKRGIDKVNGENLAMFKVKDIERWIAYYGIMFNEDINEVKKVRKVRGRK